LFYELQQFLGRFAAANKLSDFSPEDSGSNRSTQVLAVP